VKLRWLGQTVRALATASLLVGSGCATAFLRSGGTEPEHAFPAATFDAQFFWHQGIKGEPLFISLPTKDRSNSFGRSARNIGASISAGVGAIIDTPFSVALDTILFPLDLLRLRLREEDWIPEDEPMSRE
jgi:uncharacterized protein YceK